MSCRGATCTIAARQEHTLPALPYEYNALAPVVNADIMELHHKKHHATYVNNLNNAEKQLKEATDAGIQTSFRLLIIWVSLEVRATPTCIQCINKPLRNSSFACLLLLTTHLVYLP